MLLGQVLASDKDRKNHKAFAHPEAGQGESCRKVPAASFFRRRQICCGKCYSWSVCSSIMLELTQLQPRSEQVPEPLKKAQVGRIRYLVLGLVCFTSFGAVYAFDIPQAVQESYQQHLQINQAEFNLLYSLFAFPCIFTAIPLGYFVDRFGVRLGLVVLTIGSAFGQSLHTLAIWANNYHCILLARMIQGISYESLIVAQAAMACKWFRGKEASFAMGLIITLPELGDALNSILTPPLYQMSGSLVLPNLVALGLTVLGALSAVVIGTIDLKVKGGEQEGEKVHEEINIKEVKQFPWAYWLVILLLMLTIGNFVTFMDNANAYFVGRFGFTQVEAGRVTLITYLATVFSSPLIGSLTDRTRNKRLLIFITPVLFLLCHVLFISYPSGPGPAPVPVATMALFGISYAMYASCVYPAVSDLVKPTALGTAYGIQTLTATVGMSVMPLVTGLLIDSKKTAAGGFQLAEIFFLGQAILGVLIAVVLLCYRRKDTECLNRLGSVGGTEGELSLLEHQQTE